MQFVRHTEMLETIGQKSFDVVTPCESAGLKENLDFSEGIHPKTNNSPTNNISLKKKSIFIKSDHIEKHLANFDKYFEENKGNKLIYL